MRSGRTASSYATRRRSSNVDDAARRRSDDARRGDPQRKLIMWPLGMLRSVSLSSWNSSACDRTARPKRPLVLGRGSPVRGEISGWNRGRVRAGSTVCPNSWACAGAHVAPGVGSRSSFAANPSSTASRWPSRWGGGQNRRAAPNDPCIDRGRSFRRGDGVRLRAPKSMAMAASLVGESPTRERAIWSGMC